MQIYILVTPNDRSQTQKFFINAGPWLEGVWQVHLHLSILGNRCMHPSIFRPDTTFTVFRPIFLANYQICTCQLKFLSRALPKVHFFYHRSFFYVLPSQPQAPDLSNWLLLHCKQCNQLAQVRFCDSCLVIQAKFGQLDKSGAWGCDGRT